MFFTIKPYEAAGPVRLGMSYEEMTGVLGKPRLKCKTCNGKLSCKFDDFKVILSADGSGIEEINFYPSAALFFEGVDLFNDSQAFEFLLKRDGAPYEFVGVINLLNLGLSLSGFHDHDESHQCVNVFKKGTFDHFQHRFVKYGHR